MANKIVITVIMLLILVIFYAFTSANIVGYAVYEPENEIVHVNEEIPIIVENDYVEEQTESHEVCEDKLVEYSIIAWNGTYECTENALVGNESICIKKRASCFVSLRNDGPGAGDFVVGMLFVIGDQRSYGEDITQYLDVGESKEFRWPSEIVVADREVYCDYAIRKIASYQECKEQNTTKQVVKTRNITVTRTIEKDVITTKNKSIEKNKYVNRLFGYEQKFYLGY